VSGATRPERGGAVTPSQVIAGVLLAAAVLWLLAPFAGVDPPAGLTSSNAPWTDEGFNLAGARERVLAGRFATGDIDRSLTNGAYSALAAGVFTVTGPSLAAGRAISMVAVAGAVLLLLALGLAGPLGGRAALLAAAALGGANLLLEHGRLALVEATVAGLAVAVPGVAGYLAGALDSGRSRELGQRVLAASLPEDAVVYGAYAPTLLFIVAASRASLGRVMRSWLRSRIAVVCSRCPAMCCMNHTSVSSVAAGRPAPGAAQPAANTATTSQRLHRRRTMPPSPCMQRHSHGRRHTRPLEVSTQHPPT
jgi:hypothetical protein